MKTKQESTIENLKTEKITEEYGKEDLQPASENSHSSFLQKTRSFFRWIVVLGAVSIILFILVSALSFMSGMNLSLGITQTIDKIFGEDLKTDNTGKTNMLLLGIGGGNHDGANLTDSIMIASYDHEKKDVTLISLPRDLYVPVAKGYNDRINSVYDYYKRKVDDATGIEQMKILIQQITGLEIQYYAKINFQGFEEVIDILGGVDVMVPTRLVDSTYPVENDQGEFLRHEQFIVEAGLQHMNGETALKYARSRHSTSDFDRAKRQQLIISALKEKAMKENYLTSTGKIKRMYYAISSHFETDANINEIIRGAVLGQQVESDHIISVGINNDPSKFGGLLYTPDRNLTGGASVLLPQGSGVTAMNFGSFYRLVDIATNHQEIFIEKARIHVTNGTKQSGLAGTARDLFNRYGFQVVSVGNMENKATTETSTIFVSNKEAFKETLETLETFLTAEVVERPHTNNSNDSNEYDIEIVIGNDQASSFSN